MDWPGQERENRSWLSGLLDIKSVLQDGCQVATKGKFAVTSINRRGWTTTVTFLAILLSVRAKWSLSVFKRLLKLLT
jgi:hypothetical protein